MADAYGQSPSRRLTRRPPGAVWAMTVYCMQKLPPPAEVVRASLRQLGLRAVATLRCDRRQPGSHAHTHAPVRALRRACASPHLTVLQHLAPGGLTQRGHHGHAQRGRHAHQAQAAHLVPATHMHTHAYTHTYACVLSPGMRNQSCPCAPDTATATASPCPAASCLSCRASSLPRLPWACPWHVTARDPWVNQRRCEPMQGQAAATPPSPQRGLVS